MDVVLMPYMPFPKNKMKYNKLVRDKVPKVIERNGETPITHVADDEEYWEKLKQKLLEESKEFFEEPSEEELADILEVISAIKDFKNFDEEKIEEVRKKKAEEKGLFNEKIILDEVKE